MTNTQKEQIALLRGKGDSYAKIATALYISENTVKSFCRRNKVSGGLPVSNTQEETNQSFCKQCGRTIIQTPKRKQKVFCALPCRMEWWKAHPEQIRQKAVYSFSCSQCQIDFTAYGNKRRKFCSHDCYIASRFGGEMAKAGAVYE